MKKDKLIRLYEKFEQERLNTLFITNLKNLSDHEIDLLLQSKYFDLTAQLMNNKNFKMLNKEYQEQIINFLNSSKNKEIATYASFLIDEQDVIGTGLITEIFKIICSSQESYQASNAINVATNKNVILQDSPLSLIELVSKTKNSQNCFNAMQVATNELVLINGPVYTLTQLVSEAPTNIKSDLAASVAKNKILLQTPMVIVYTKKIVNAKTDEEAKLIYSEIRRIIKEQEQLEKANEEQTSINEVLFWKAYQQNPEEAIKHLKENIKDNKDITINTKIKRKKI